MRKLVLYSVIAIQYTLNIEISENIEIEKSLTVLLGDGNTELKLGGNPCAASLALTGLAQVDPHAQRQRGHPLPLVGQKRCSCDNQR